jgi:hypothetical protein
MNHNVYHTASGLDGSIPEAFHGDLRTHSIGPLFRCHVVELVMRKANQMQGGDKGGGWDLGNYLVGAPTRANSVQLTRGRFT